MRLVITVRYLGDQQQALTPRPPLPNLGEGVPEAKQRAGVRAIFGAT